MTDHVPETQILDQHVVLLLTDDRRTQLSGRFHLVEQMSMPTSSTRDLSVKTLRDGKENPFDAVVESMQSQGGCTHFYIVGFAVGQCLK